MAGARDATELEVWRLADDVRCRVFGLTKCQAFDQHDWLRAQLNRAAQSACANLSEGFSRYRPRDFARSLDYVRGSLSEVIEHVHAAMVLGLATDAEVAAIVDSARRALGAATRLIVYLRSSAARKHGSG